MVRQKRWSVTAGAALTALLLGTGMFAINVYGSDFLTDAVLEDVQEPEDSENFGNDIFSDGSDAGGNPDADGNGGNGSDVNGNGDPGINGGGGSIGGGYYSSGGGTSGSTEKILRQPKLMLESSNLAGAQLLAGSENTFQAVFSNKSKNQRIYNLKVTLASESKDVYISQKTFYFGSVLAGGTITLNSGITIQPGAEEGQFPVTASFEYEDKKGTACTGTENMEFRIVQPSEVVFECGDLPAGAASTDTLMLTVKAQNLSRTEVHNVRISLKGKGLFPKEEVFIGNLDAGTQGEGVMRVYVGTKTMEKLGLDEGTSESEMYGTVKGKLTLTYEDSSGNTHKDAKNFKMEITKPKIQSIKVEKPKKANSWWLSVVAVAGAGMVMVIVLLLGRIRRQRIRMEEMKKMYM